MGSQWKKHKYIRIENGRYIYPGDEKSGKKHAQDSYKNMQVEMKKLKQQQLEYEKMIDDGALGDKGRTKIAYKAGDDLDRVLNKIDKLGASMKNHRKVYRNTFGRKMSDDMKSKKDSNPKTVAEAFRKRIELSKQISELKKQRSEYKRDMERSTKKSDYYYKKSDKYSNNKKSDGYQINGIIGKKYESSSQRFASKLNAADRRIDQLNKQMILLGNNWIKKYMNKKIKR